MFKLSSLGLILASTLLVSVVVLVSCKDIKKNGCDELDDYLLQELPNELDPARNYKVALDVSVLSFAKRKVANKWKLIHEAVGSSSCSDTSIKKWLSFGSCFFREQKRLAAVMKPDLIKFADICQEAIVTFLRNKQEKEELRVYPVSREPLVQFMSDSFISQYLETHPSETSDDFVNNRCCRPVQSIQLSIDSLQKMVQKEKKVDEKTASKMLRDRVKLIKIVDDYVIYACDNYRQMMNFHFYYNLNLDKKLGLGLQRMAIDDESSNEFKYNVFRFQFCLRLKSKQEEQDFKNGLIAGLGATFN